MINMIIEQWEVRGCPPAAGWGRGRIGNGVRIPDRTAAVLPSEAQNAIGSNPRRPRDAMKLSQKTCLRSAYQIFGLKRDMFLSCARCGCSRGRRLRYCVDCGIYRELAGVSRFYVCPFRENTRFPAARRIGRRTRRHRLVPGCRAHVVPGCRRGVPSPQASGASSFPLGRRPGFGIAGNRGLKGFSII